MTHPWRVAALSLLIATTAVGCGGTASTTSAPGGATTSAAIAAASAPTPASVHVAILSPRRGARTGASVTVRTTVSGARGVALKYVLDGGSPRHGSRRFTLRHLRAGRHRLVVLLARDATVRARTTFTVRPHPPAPKPATKPATTVTTVTTPAGPPPPVTTAASPATAAPPPPPPPPPPATTTTSATATTPSSGGIPQNNGGDGDADNSGGPTDGDGNI